MLSDLFDQIFGRSKCGKREIVTTTIVEPDSCDDFTLANDSNATRICFLPSTFLLSDGSETNNDDDGDGDDSIAYKLNSHDDGDGADDNGSQPQHKQQSITVDQRSALLQQQWRQPSPFQGKITAHNTTMHSQKQCLSNQYRQHHHFHQNRTNPSLNQQKKLNELSIFSVYLLFITLFMCCCTIAALLFTYINRANDIMQLRDSLTSQFIVRNDIDAIIRNVLREMKTGTYANDDGNGNGDDAENIYTDMFRRGDGDGHQRNNNNNKNANNKNNDNHIEASNQNGLR